MDLDVICTCPRMKINAGWRCSGARAKGHVFASRPCIPSDLFVPYSFFLAFGLIWYFPFTSNPCYRMNCNFNMHQDRSVGQQMQNPESRKCVRCHHFMPRINLLLISFLARPYGDKGASLYDVRTGEGWEVPKTQMKVREFA